MNKRKNPKKSFKKNILQSIGKSVFLKIGDYFLKLFKFISKKEIIIFQKNNNSVSFNPFLLTQGLIVLIFAIFVSSSVGSFFIPEKPQISETKIIKDVIVKQASPVVVNGESVKWTILVKRSDINQDQSLVQLPKDAKNVKVKKINSTEVQQILSQQKSEPSEHLTLKERKKLVLVSQPSSFFVASLFSGISKFFLANVEDALDQVIETITQEVTTTEDAKLVDLSEQALTEPVVEETTIEPEVVEEQQETITEEPKIVEEAITEEPEETTEVIPEPEVTEEEQPAEEEVTTEEPIETTETLTETETEEEIPTITEEAGSLNILETVSPSNQELIETEITEAPTEEEYVEITYETPAPQITEEETDKGKLVTISADDTELEEPLTDVVAFTTIPEIYKVGQENKIKIKWKNNGDQEVEFHAYDLDGNGKLDYVEWTVPHLSEQIFEIIFISKAFRLDSDKNIVEDIYDQTITQDGNWAPVPDGNYVRVTFKKILDNTKDNTIYAKPSNSGDSVTIEVYPVYADEDGNQTEGPLVATFNNIDHEDKYRVLLTNLQVPTDVFDLKVIGDVDIDWIVDPVLTYYWSPASDGADTSVASNWTLEYKTGCGDDPSSTLPGPSDEIIFNWDCVNGAVIDSALSVEALTTESGYNGTIFVAAPLTVSGSMTLGSGAVFNNIANQNINVGGNVIMDNDVTDMGVATWTVGGNFDYVSVTGFTANASTLVMTGTANLMGKSSSTLYNLSIPVGAVVTETAGSISINNSLVVGGTFNVNAELTINSNKTLTLQDNSTLNGTSMLYTYNSPIFTRGSNTTVGVPITCFRTITLPAGTYGGAVTFRSASSTPYTFSFSGASYVFQSSLNFSSTSTGLLTVSPDAGASIEVDGDLIFNSTSTGNITVTDTSKTVDWIIKGNVSRTGAGSATLTWNKGNGTITFSGGNANIDFLGQSLENVTINSTGTKTVINNSITTTDLTVTAGTLDMVALGLTVSGNLLINGGTLDGSDASCDIDVDGNVTVSSGTLSAPAVLSDTNFTVGGTWAVSATGAFTHNTGRVIFDGSGTQTLEPSTYHFNDLAYSGTGTLQPKTSDLYIDGSFTLSLGAGIFDNATNDKNITVAGNVTMDNTRIDMGDGTWTVSGNWDSRDITTLNANASTLVMDGTDKTITLSGSRYLFNLTISGTITLSNNTSSWGSAKGVTRVTGIFTLDTTTFYSRHGTVNGCYVDVDGGTITGTGTLIVFKISQMTGTINCKTLTLDAYNYNLSIVPAQYDSETVNIFSNGAGARKFTTSNAGTITIPNNLVVEVNKADYSFEIENDTYNNSWVVGGNITLTQTAGTLIWTKGTGNITLSSSANQSINFLDKTIEDVVINKTSGTATLADGFTADSLTLTSGTVDFNGQTIATAGDLTIGTSGNVNSTNLAGSTINVGGNFSASGSDGDLLTLNASNTWYLNVTGTANASYVNVAYSDASGGTLISQTNCTDSGNNINWGFNTAPTLTSISDSPDPLKGGSQITITPTGQADDDSDDLYFYCNEAGTPTSANTLCSQDNTSYSTDYSSMTCTYNVDTGDTTRTVYCRVYDGTEYSSETTTTYAVDSTPPAPSSFSPASGSTITTTTPTITFTTSENADCYASTTDEAYDDMADNTNCTGDGTTSQSCTMSDLGADGEKNIYIACQDTAGNKDTSDTNEALIYTLDSTPPAPSSFSPASGSTITTTTPTITFTTSENADCYASTTDEAYDDMADNTNCTGDGTTSQSCTMSDLGADGEKNIYIACQDTAGNKDTIATNEALTYTLDTTPPTVSSVLPASMSTITTTTPTITFTTDENADCYASTTDEAYDDMSDDIDCTGDGTTSQSCTMSDLGADGPKLIYISCKDSNENKDTVDSNYNLVYTLDTAPPIISSVLPASGSTITTTTPTITFTTSENADCYASTTDEAYDDMADNTNCTGDDTTSQSCTMSDLGADGSKNIYIACQDTAGNKDTISTNTELSYTLDVPTPTPTPTPTTSTGGGGNSFILPTSIPNQIIEIPAKAIEQIIKITDQVINLVIPKEAEKKPEVIIIPEETPLAFTNPEKLLSLAPIKQFVFNSLPQELQFFTEKFVGLENTFEKVGISKISDITKLENININLPGLTVSSKLSSGEIKAGSLEKIDSIPVNELSLEAKQNIPTEIIFAKTASGLIDFNTVLSLNSKGEPEQKIRTLAGKTLELITKPDRPVKNIKGYLILKRQTEKIGFFEDLFGSMSASLTDSVANEKDSQKKNIKTEQKLVLQEFEYTDPDKDGIYIAEITSPVIDGEYEVITVMNYEDPELALREFQLILVIDPEGYVYSQLSEGKLRISGAKVSLYWLNPETNEYEIWPAKKYQQDNPQITNDTGKYSFLVPEGEYYLTVISKKYFDYNSEIFSVVEGGGVHMDLALERKSWFKMFINWIKNLFY